MAKKSKKPSIKVEEPHYEIAKQPQPAQALCVRYNAFVMGGKIRQYCLYPIAKAFLVEWPLSARVFVHENFEGLWAVREAQTGGEIVVHKDRDVAVQQAMKLILETPNFEEQIASVAMESKTSISAEEAKKLLTKRSA